MRRAHQHDLVGEGKGGRPLAEEQRPRRGRVHPRTAHAAEERAGDSRQSGAGWQGTANARSFQQKAVACGGLRWPAGSRRAFVALAAAQTETPARLFCAKHRIFSVSFCLGAARFGNGPRVGPSPMILSLSLHLRLRPRPRQPTTTPPRWLVYTALASPLPHAPS